MVQCDSIFVRREVREFIITFAPQVSSQICCELESRLPIANVRDDGANLPDPCDRPIDNTFSLALCTWDNDFHRQASRGPLPQRRLNLLTG